MLYDIFSPSQELKSIVKHYIVITSLEGIDELLFLPNGCNFIVFNRGLEGCTKLYKEDVKFEIPKNYSISIKSNKARKFIINDSCKDITFPIILVELTAIGFYKLFNRDASVLKNGYLEIQNETVESYFKDVYTHNSIEEELEYLNNSLSALHDSHSHTHMLIEDIIDKITNSYHFEVTVESLVKEFECSRSTMERNFKKIVGLTPKNFIFISKFCKTVLAYIEDKCSFKELEYLYSDNSYMNAVFKKFLGVSPSVILNQVLNNEIRIYQMHKSREKKLDDK